MKQVAPGLRTLSGQLMGRVYLTEDDDGGLTLIDTALAMSAPRALRQLADAGRQPGDVKRIIITHAHPDHVGGLPALKAATGAEVIASYVERPYVEGRLAMPLPPKQDLPLIWRLPISPPPPGNGTPVDRDVADGEVIRETWGGLQVVFTPGHSPGHMSLWQPEMRVLITGDVLMNLPLFGLRLPVPAFTTNMAEDKRSLRRIAALEPQIVCFGHGQPLREDAAAKLHAFADKAAPAG